MRVPAASDGVVSVDVDYISDDSISSSSSRSDEVVAMAMVDLVK